MPGPHFAFVVPGEVAAVSGGTVYDKRMVDALRALGVGVDTYPVPGAWPGPDAGARAALDDALDAVLETGGTGATAVVDGLIGSAAPASLERFGHLGGRSVLLVHLPLGADPARIRSSARDARSGTVAVADAERAALAAAGTVVCTGTWSAHWLARHHDLPSGRTRVVEPGTDPAPPATGSTPPRLLMVGTMAPIKGQDRFVDALWTCRAQAWTARLIGPDGPDAAYVAAVRAAADRLGDRCRLPGIVQGAALEAEYAAADLLVLPSRVETYGMVVAEALARGVPAVVSRGTGPAVLIGAGDAPGSSPAAASPAGAAPVAGAAVDMADPRALPAVLARWLTDPALRDRWRRAAVARGGALPDWPAAARRFLAALNPAAARGVA